MKTVKIVDGYKITDYGDGRIEKVIDKKPVIDPVEQQQPITVDVANFKTDPEKAILWVLKKLGGFK